MPPRFRTFGCFISLCLLLAAPVSSQEKDAKVVRDSIPFYNGMFAGIDLYGAGSKLIGGDYLSSELSLQVNLKNRYLPVVEIGVGGGEAWSDGGTHYRGRYAPYFRIGMDYNTMAKKREKLSYLYVGLRYAFTSFRYDIANLPISDQLWGDVTQAPLIEDSVWGGLLPFDHRDMRLSMQWAEIILGVKVNIVRRLNMGWSVRMKYRLNASVGAFGNPDWVPGYGTFGANSMGLTYSIVYQLPF